MFESFYRFDENPFRLNPDEKFRYIHPNYLKAWSYLKYGLDHAEGFVMITGEPGTGKTTLVQSMLSELDHAKYLQVTLVSNQLQAEELLRLLALQFGFNADTYNKATLLTRIENYVSEQYAAGRRAIIIIDEAQNLNPQALEELRLLLNLQTGNHALFQIFLIGQEELRNLVLGPGMEQFQQRLVATFRIEAMNTAQTEGYIEHRLGVVGWLDDPLLNPSIYPLIYRFTQGIPRKINHILSRLLLYGALEEKHRLDQDDVWVVLEELNEEVRLMPDSPMDFEALKQESREHVLQDEAAHQKVAQSDIAIREPLRTEPSDAEKNPSTHYDAPLNLIRQEQLSNEFYCPVNRDEGSSSFPDQISLSQPGRMPIETGLPETQPEKSSVPKRHDDHLSKNINEITESEPLLVIPANEQTALTVAVQLPETDSPDKKDLIFGGLERFFHWSAYALGVAVFAFVILLPQTNELADLWQDLKFQGLRMLGLTHQHQTDLQSQQVLETTSITQAETTSPDQSDKETVPERQPEEQVRETTINRSVTSDNTSSRPIDEASIAQPGITEASPEMAKTMDQAADINAVNPAEPDPWLSPTQPIPSKPANAQITDQSPRQSEKAQTTSEETDPWNATKAQVTPDLTNSPEVFSTVEAIRQKEFALRQAAEADFQSQLTLERNDTSEKTDTYQSVAEDAITAESVTTLTTTPDQPEQPTPIIHQTHQLYFKFNSTAISDEYIPDLNSVLGILSRHEKTLVEITGFSDTSGDPIYNKLLSFRRAKAVANYLVDRGISQGRIHVTGGGALPAQSGVQSQGPEEPIHQRRVEIKTIAIDDRSNP